MIFYNPDVVRVSWIRAHRLIRSRFPRIHLFEDIADPADWDAVISAETKTNPRVAENMGILDLVPESRRVGGEGASWSMAPLVHTSTAWPSRFSDGPFGIYYAGDRIEVALFETMHHHGTFMAATGEEPGWTSDFQELVGTLDADLHDVSETDRFGELYQPDDYAMPQKLGADLRRGKSNGLLYRSVRYPDGMALALFWPYVPSIPKQDRQFSYFWTAIKFPASRT